MLVVGTFIYAFIFAIGVRSGLGFLAIVAATLAVVAGAFFAIFLPVGILVWQLQGGEGNPKADLLWALFNAAGCIAAFLWVRRRLPAH
jgi:hypothetical protein